MRGNSRNTETRAGLVGDVIGKCNRLPLRHTRQLGGGAERPVGLGAVRPDPLPDPAIIHTIPDRVDYAGAVTAG
jgi:hypothetical protein